MIDRIEQIAGDARAAIAEATTTGALEQARVQWLGRKAELPNLLRGVAELEPAERGRVGKAANQARRELEEAIAARHAELEAAELDRRLVEGRGGGTLPGRPPHPGGRPPPL